MTGPQILRDRSPTRIDAAARIWAAATSARDGGAEVANLELARPMVSAALTLSGSVLLTAVDAGQRSLGIAVAHASGSGRSELRLLGVAPEVWGRGIAGALLAEVHDSGAEPIHARSGRVEWRFALPLAGGELSGIGGRAPASRES